jgi:hypothetical protein
MFRTGVTPGGFVLLYEALMDAWRSTSGRADGIPPIFGRGAAAIVARRAARDAVVDVAREMYGDAFAADVAKTMQLIKERRELSK